jgi:hypothetical protein
MANVPIHEELEQVCLRPGIPKTKSAVTARHIFCKAVDQELNRINRVNQVSMKYFEVP